VISLAKIRVKFGNEILESPEMDIRDFAKLVSILRKFSSGVVNGVINLDWRVIAFTDDLINKLREIKIDNVFIEKLSDIVKEKVKEVPKIIIEDDHVLLLVHNYNPYEIAEKLGGELRLRVTRSMQIEVPYLAFNRGDIFSLISYVDAQDLALNFRNILKLLKEKIERENVIYITSYGVKFIEIKVPWNAPSSLIKELKELGTIEYYVSDPSEEELQLKSEKLYKIDRREDTLVIRLPSFTLTRIENIIKKYGFTPKIDISLPQSIKIKISKNFKLMSHQEEALNRWMDANKLGTVVIPTGGGKTLIALAAIVKMKKPAIIFVPNKLLLWQWRDRIKKFLLVPEEKIGILGAGERNIKEITVATYQSGVKYIEKIADKFSLAIFDEGHHVPARTFKDVALYLRAPYRMALSATPRRHDKNEILLFKLSGRIVYEISFPELVRQGILAPLAVRKILVPLPNEYMKLYKSLEKEVEGEKIPLEKKRKINRLIEIARDNPNKIKVLREIVKRHKDEKMFIFAGSINFAETIKLSIKDLIPAEVLTAKTSEVEEKRILKAFLDGEIRALILVKKGEEGLDVGDASVAIIAGGTKQIREFIQRVGRVLRGGVNKLAWVYEVVTKDTIEEALSRARRARELVRGIENFISKNFKVKAFKVEVWNENR